MLHVQPSFYFLDAVHWVTEDHWENVAD